MFTVKWIADNGAEMIYSARDVSFTPGETVAPAPVIVRPAPMLNPDPVQTLVTRDISKPAVSFYSVDDDVHCVLDNGRVYVMNDRGKTVAHYVLSTVEFPHGLAPRQAA